MHRLFPILFAAAGLAQTHKQAALSVHLLRECSGEATVKVKLPEGTRCLDPTPFLTQQDVESAEVQKNAKGIPMVLVTFHNDAAMRELRITRQNIGNPVAIVVNGKVVSSPVIAAASRLLYIEGNFKPDEAAALASALVQRARAR